MYHEFKELGKIDEVFIRSRKSIWEKKYGFVKFFNVNDERMLEMKLDNIFLDGRKIFANLPKYGRKVKWNEHGGTKTNGVTKVNAVLKSQTKTGGSYGNQGLRKKVSFAEVLRGEISSKVLEYQAEKDDLEKLGKSYMGEVVSLSLTYCMQAKLYAKGFFRLKLNLLGRTYAYLRIQKKGL